MYPLVKYLHWNEFTKILNRKGIIKLLPEEKSDDSGYESITSWYSMMKPKRKTGKFHLFIETLFSANDVGIEVNNFNQKYEFTLEAEETIEHNDSVYVLFACFPSIGYPNENYFLMNHKYGVIYNLVEELLLDLAKRHPDKYSGDVLKNIIGVSPINI